jgi:hypothetical protein
VRASLDDTPRGRKHWLGLAGFLVALFAILLVQLALDLARIRVARDDVRKGVRVFRATLRAVLPPLAGARSGSIWLPLAAAFVAIAALYLGIQAAFCRQVADFALLVLFLAQDSCS